MRRYSSDDKLPAEDPLLNIPPYWVRPPQKLASEPGMHRFLWDMHWPPVTDIAPEFPMSAVVHNTAPEFE